LSHEAKNFAFSVRELQFRGFDDERRCRGMIQATVGNGELPSMLYRLEERRRMNAKICDPCLNPVKGSLTPLTLLN
jgi:hypothetical protein